RPPRGGCRVAGTRHARASACRGTPPSPDAGHPRRNDSPGARLRGDWRSGRRHPVGVRGDSRIGFRPIAARPPALLLASGGRDAARRGLRPAPAPRWYRLGCGRCPAGSVAFVARAPVDRAQPADGCLVCCWIRRRSRRSPARRGSGPPARACRHCRGCLRGRGPSRRPCPPAAAGYPGCPAQCVARCPAPSPPPAPLLLPALRRYPSRNAVAAAAKEGLVPTEFGPQAARQREVLQTRRLPHSLEAIDALPPEGQGSLADLVTSPSDEATPTTDRAFLVWSQTELSEFRTTSAVELYGPNGRLVSRFALNLPEYGATPYEGGTCGDWDVYEEVTPPGSAPRYVLRASRAICVQRRRVGAVVVRAMLDYRALPFISTQSPYYESMRPSRRLPSEGVFGRDVEFVLYGWSRAPIYESGASVWPLGDNVFEQMVASRVPIWENVTRNNEAFRVYFFNDRGGIYALGYPRITPFGHVINLGELMFLTAVLYTLLLAGGSLFGFATSQTPAGGRALLRVG